MPHFTVKELPHPTFHYFNNPPSVQVSPMLLYDHQTHNNNTTYNFRIRFIKLDDLNEINMAETAELHTDLSDYLLQQPCILKEVALTPPWTHGYAIQGITVPRGTDIITFYNGTNEPTESTTYHLSLSYSNPADNHSYIMETKTGSNRFIVKPTSTVSRLRVIDYSIADEDNVYKETDCSVYQLSTSNVWTHSNLSPHERPRRNQRPVYTIPALSYTPI